MAMFCSKMIGQEVRDRIASGKHSFAFQDVLFQRTAALTSVIIIMGMKATEEK